MSELVIENVKNLDKEDVKELLHNFKQRHEMNVVDVAEIISKLITTLKVDHDSGRPKTYTISGGHLGQILNIGKGVVSQYMSVWNMPQESKEFLKNYNLSLIAAYKASRINGKDEAEIIMLQKKEILENCNNTSGGVTCRKTDALLHAINEAQMILNGVIVSSKIPAETLIKYEGKDTRSLDNISKKAKIIIENIERCIRFLSPRIVSLHYLRKEIEFCNIMLENNEVIFCGKEITKDCLNKQIKKITEEIFSIEEEQKLPQISSLIMMKNNLEKNI